MCLGLALDLPQNGVVLRRVDYRLLLSASRDG